MNKMPQPSRGLSRAVREKARTQATTAGHPADIATGGAPVDRLLLIGDLRPPIPIIPIEESPSRSLIRHGF